MSADFKPYLVDGFHDLDPFLEGEGLAYEKVGAKIIAFVHFGLIGGAGKHNDRDVPVPVVVTELLDHGKAADFGHVQIQDNKVGEVGKRVSLPAEIYKFQAVVKRPHFMNKLIGPAGLFEKEDVLPGIIDDEDLFV